MVFEYRPRVDANMKRARRAAAACHTCHKRKVRCDALIHGQPCTNCRIDGRDDCAVRTKPQGMWAFYYHQPKYDKTYVLIKFLRDRPRRVTSSPASSTKGDKSDNVSKIPQGEIELFKDQDTTTPFAITGLNNRDSATPPKGNVLFSSYRFLDGSRLCSLPSEDVEFLLLKRCLHFPRKDALDEFVKQYFAMVHPFLPLIDEGEFWRQYSGIGSKKISLFVFQAMLSSACSVSCASISEFYDYALEILTNLVCLIGYSSKMWFCRQTHCSIRTTQESQGMFVPYLTLANILWEPNKLACLTQGRLCSTLEEKTDRYIEHRAVCCFRNTRQRMILTLVAYGSHRQSALQWLSLLVR